MMGRWVYKCQRELLVAHGKEGKDTALSAGNGEVPRLMPRGTEVCECSGDVGLFLLTYIPYLVNKLKFLFGRPRIFKKPLSYQALHGCVFLFW